MADKSNRDDASASSAGNIEDLHDRQALLEWLVAHGDSDHDFAARIASPSNVSEVEQLLIVLARAMPPQTSLRQALAFLMIARAILRGLHPTAAWLRREAGLSNEKGDLLGPALSRTLRPLANLGLISIVESDYDRRSDELRLTPTGMALIVEALDQLS